MSRLFVLSLLLLSLPGITFAQTLDQRPWYFSLDVGAAFPGDFKTDAAFPLPGAADYSLDPGLSVGGVIGYDLGRLRTDLEVGLQWHNLDGGNLAMLPGRMKQDPAGTVSILRFMLNGWFNVLNVNGWQADVGGGLGFAETDFSFGFVLEEDVNGQVEDVHYRVKESDWNVAFQVGGWVSRALSRDGTSVLDVGYRYRQTRYNPADTDVSSHVVAFRWRQMF